MRHPALQKLQSSHRPTSFHAALADAASGAEHFQHCHRLRRSCGDCRICVWATTTTGIKSSSFLRFSSSPIAKTCILQVTKLLKAPSLFRTRGTWGAEDLRIQGFGLRPSGETDLLWVPECSLNTPKMRSGHWATRTSWMGGPAPTKHWARRAFPQPTTALNFTPKAS